MGLLRLVFYFSLVWIGIIFIFLAFNALLTLNILYNPPKFYASFILISSGFVLITIGVAYIIQELKGGKT